MNGARGAARGLIALTVVALVAACSTSSGPPGGGNVNFDASNVDAAFGNDATSGDDASPDGAAASSLAACLSGVVTGSPPAVCSPFISCVETSCSTQLSATCFGAWATGTIGGDCASFETCATGRGCTPSAGVTCYDQAPSSCQACVLAVYDCSVTQCKTPFFDCVNGLLSGLVDGGTTPPGDASTADAAEASSPAADSGTMDSGVDASTGDSSTSLDASSDAIAPSDAGTTGFGTITSVSVGNGTACALTSVGGVVCWGSSSNGQLGNGSLNPSVDPVQVTGLTSGATSVSVGPGPSACAVTAAGGVVCWGANANGELGNGTMTDSAVPVPVTGLTSGVASVSVGTFDACAVTTSGAVWCWGDNTFGQLGNGTMTSSPVPVPVSGLGSGVASVSMGEFTACAVTTAGALSCWGYNGDGELGNGTQTTSPTPVPVSGITVGATSVSVGLYTTCAVVAASAMCWGENSAGVLGNGSAATWSLTPVQVSGLTSGVVSVSMQEASACALLTGGDVMCWGEGNGGTLGNGSTNDSSVPVLVTGLAPGATSISAGFSSACATVGCGVQCWGDTALGNSVTTSSDVPVSVDLLGTGPCMSGFGAAVSVSAGYPFACALTSAGAVVCWGDNSSGELGNGSTVSYSTVPVQVTGLGSGVQSVSAGQESSACAITAAGAVVCWGDNSDGQLGNGSSAASSNVPVPVTGLTSGVKAVSVGTLGVCAVTTSGAAWCWGDNSSGQLGNGSVVTFSNVPVQVSTLTSGAIGVAAGGGFNCALLTGGAVDCWGAGSEGELGDDSPSDSPTPVSVMGISGAGLLSASSLTACAAGPSGLSCWGNNDYGQLANMIAGYSLVPVMAGGITSVTSLSGSDYSWCATTATGSVLCWGNNGTGQLGNGGAEASSDVPVQVTGLTSGATSASSGGQSSCAVVACGVQCWGANSAGQLGDGTVNASSVPVPVSLLGASSCP